MKILLGNDNGNSTHKMVMNGDYISQPNVFAKVPRLPRTLGEIQAEKTLEDIHNRLLVCIESPTLDNGTATTYYVGQYAIDAAGKVLRTMDLGARGRKTDSDIPIVSTLAHIAAYAVKKTYEKEGDLQKTVAKTINADVDMATALPVTQYDPQNANTFAEKFIGKHSVKVYLGSHTAQVNVNIGYVKVLPEAQPAVFYLQSDHNIPELKKYNFAGKKIQHVAIGEGTTEYPITNNITPIISDDAGSDNGVGVAIQEMQQQFINENHLDKYSRQELSMVLRNKNHKYHDSAIELIEYPLEAQAIEIKNNTFRQLSRANNDVDYILVYGGGSILMEKFLKAEFEKDPTVKSEKNPKGIELIYITADYATSLEAKGLYVFASTSAFAAKAKEYRETHKN